MDYFSDMTIWLLALALLASLAGLGYRQGVIRVAFSLVGILVGALLAVPAGNLIKPLFAVVGVKNPLLVWLLAPIIFFLFISIAFKLAALPMHLKVEMYYKHRSGDLQLALWERISRRLGLCLGLLNGLLYLILISFLIYLLSYWTVQVAGSENEPRSVRILNQMGWDLQNTGFAKVARAIDRMPQTYYEAADLTGILYNTPLAEARLVRYPVVLELAEQPEFQELAHDNIFTEMRLQKKEIRTIIDYPKVQAILQNPALLQSIWAALAPNFKDLSVYLETGKSPKYGSEKLLGCWSFNVNAALSRILQAKPDISASEMRKTKRWMVFAFAGASFVAMPDHRMILKEVPTLVLPAPGVATSSATETLQGRWKNLDGKYQIALSGGARRELPAVVEGERLTIKAEGLDLVFDRAN